jgi:hypothetical protein
VAGARPGYRDLFAAPPPDDEVLSCEIGGAAESVHRGRFVPGDGGDQAHHRDRRALLGRVLFYDALTRAREIAYAVDETRAP